MSIGIPEIESRSLYLWLHHENQHQHFRQDRSVKEHDNFSKFFNFLLQNLYEKSTWHIGGPKPAKTPENTRPEKSTK